MFPLLPVAVRWQRAKLGITPDPLEKYFSGEAERRRCEDDVVQLWRIEYPDPSVRPVIAARFSGLCKARGNRDSIGILLIQIS